MQKNILFVIGLFSLGLQFSCQDSSYVRGTEGPAPVVVINTTPELTFPHCSDLNTLWRTRYYKKLKVDWVLRDIACTGPSRDRVFAEAAYILENTVFRLDSLPIGATPPPKDMLTFVTSKYLRLTIGEETFPYTDVDKKVIYFYPDIDKESGYSVVGNLIHESRHADGLQYLHKACLDGPNKGQEMCDTGLSDSFYSGGSHPIGCLYFAWVAARSNWPAYWKGVVRDLTRYIVTTRINDSVAVRTAWVNKYLTDW